MRAATSEPDIRKDMDAIRDDLTALKADLVAAMRDMIDAGKSQTADVKEQLEKAVRDRLDRVGDAASAFARRGRDAADHFRHTVEERPIQSLAIAFGAGVVIGAVLRK